jgi:lipopolysaccharide/colanic/teichoic acid biosynthesis glycosyltransferase
MLRRPLKIYLFFKNIIDRLLSSFLLIILSPFLLLISLLLIIKQKGKFIFTQDRPGYKAKIFKIYKFRTMNDIKDNDGLLLEDMQRITSLGNFLRKTSLDELPSLVNIVRGEMSFVGPRPLLPEYLKFYTLEESKRHLVKPGLTGWAQINGRNNSSWEKRFEFDLWYVNNFSLFLDIYILINTFWKVIFQRDINKSKVSTMPKFHRDINEKKF